MVPLNSMCSTKCATPLSASDSWREPRVSHTPTVTERTWGIASVTSRKPDGSVSAVTRLDIPYPPEGFRRADFL